MTFACSGALPSAVFVPPSPIRAKSELPDLQRLLEAELGFHDERNNLREAANEEFVRAAGSLKARMDQELFVASVGQLWNLDRVSAMACFFAGDADKSNRINSGEWLIMRESFLIRSQEHADHPAIKTLQLRAALYSYDLYKDGSLGGDFEVLVWLRDLCSGEMRLRRIADSLFKALGDPELEPVAESSAAEASTATPKAIAKTPSATSLGAHSIESIVEALSPGGKLSAWLAEHDLSTDDMVRNFMNSHDFMHRVNVVYDGRAETARNPSHQGSIVSYEGGSRGGKKTRPSGVTTAGVPGHAVNENLTLHPALRTVIGWRGPMSVRRDTSLFFLCTHIIDVMARHAQQVTLAADMPGDKWRSNEALLEELLGPGEAAQADCIAMLAEACKKVIMAQPTVVRCKAPAKVFGDVHGQLRDLLLLFGWYGFPTHKGGDIQTTSYVFNGDWVDRGPHQLETILLLFSLKAMYPSRVMLVRGNHEFRSQSEIMGDEGFMAAVARSLPTEKLASKAYEAVHETFDWLPLAALVSESVLVLHGGVGDGSWGVADLARVARPLRDEHEHLCTLHALWSDPSDSDDAMRSGVHEGQRGDADIPEFGPDVTERFCTENHVSLVIRSHQFCRQGYKVMHSGRLITLFSARNYFQLSRGKANDGAMLLLAPDDHGNLRVHPKRLESYENSARMSVHASEPDWRVRLVGSLAKCLQV